MIIINAKREITSYGVSKTDGTFQNLLLLLLVAVVVFCFDNQKIHGE